MDLYNVYNFNEMKKVINVPIKTFKVIKLFDIKPNPIFLETNRFATIKFCKHILNKETSITKEDYNTVKELMLKHLYEEDMDPNDIVKLYNIKCNDSYMVNFLITSFRIKMRSVKDSVILTYKNLGYYDNKTEKELYCMKCAFNFSSNFISICIR